jgi:hypothetical protein
VEEAMTQGQWAPLPAPPPPPYGGYSYQPQLPPSKPSGIYKALGIVQMTFGVGGVLYSLVTVVTTTFGSSLMAGVYDPPTLALILIHAVVSVLSGGLLFATGFAIFRGKRWGRPMGITYAVVSMLNTFGGTATQLFIVQPKVMGRMGTVGPLRGFESLMVVSALFGVVVALVLPITTLVFVLRPAAKSELDQ